MSLVTLTNIPRDDLGIGRGPDIYPFHDANLAQHYQYLIPPSEEVLAMVDPNRPANTALERCWVHTTTSTFSYPGLTNETYIPVFWPFASTTVIERDTAMFSSDRGLLEPADLGDQTRHSAVDRAVQARRALITYYHNLPAHSRAAYIDTISPATKAKDMQRGFTLFFAKNSGSIQFRMEGENIVDMKFQIAPVCATRAGGTKSDSLAKIHLRGQA
ncbi:hypothetical protein [Sporisorium scitamineum]|uniref:Uncharacterized protein n=1 Tax=Sporisorium scitamineum TaxID=49012 RepID=A0A0F7RW53_9BASI|nr:hypothetical protein [Sporisorium scitamineum]